jgi:hypothetical protein
MNSELLAATSAKPPFVCLILVCLSKSGTFSSPWIAFSCRCIGLIIWHYVCKGSIKYITLDSAYNRGLGHENELTVLLNIYIPRPILTYCWQCAIEFGQ